MIFPTATRYLSWRYQDANFPGAAASPCIANMHLIPSNDRVRDRLLDVRVGQIVQLSGYLVQVQRPGMNAWISSLTRDDSGNGACEIMCGHHRADHSLTSSAHLHLHAMSRR